MSENKLQVTGTSNFSNLTPEQLNQVANSQLLMLSPMEQDEVTRKDEGLLTILPDNTNIFYGNVSTKYDSNKNRKMIIFITQELKAACSSLTNEQTLQLNPISLEALSYIQKSKL